LAPFLFIIVIDYVTRQSANEFGYLTHKGIKPKESGRHLRTTTTRLTEQRVADLDFADDIALLESDHTQAQLKLDSLKINASKVGLEINKDKTEQMRLNIPANSNIPAPTINGEPIAVVNDFKYLG
jgi:hypothetical protein